MPRKPASRTAPATCSHPDVFAPPGRARLCCDIDGTVMRGYTRTIFCTSRAIGIKGAVSTLRGLSQSSCIDFVTARSSRFRKAALRDLAEVGFRRSDFRQLNMTGSGSKTDVSVVRARAHAQYILGRVGYCSGCKSCIEGGGTQAWLFVDDNVDQTNACRQTCPGTLAVLFGPLAKRTKAAAGTLFASNWSEVEAIVGRLEYDRARQMRYRTVPASTGASGTRTADVAVHGPSTPGYPRWDSMQYSQYSTRYGAGAHACS